MNYHLVDRVAMTMSDMKEKTLASGDYNDWEIPEFDSMLSAKSTSISVKKGLPTADELEEIYSQAQKEGYEQGYLDGMNKAAEHLAEKEQYLGSILNLLNQPYENLADNVTESIKQLSISIAAHIVRREINHDENTVMAAVNKSLGVLKGVRHHISLYLNPDDVDLVKSMLSVNELTAIDLCADIAITRGGCRVETETSTVDATIESQLNEIAAEIIGGTRKDDA